ncbi:MAG: beta-lactamase family protein [Alphaproteobacteria bacterium]|jgi:CubicO group peptidase (beta-lactamase class C family)|nr:beta-lactamase family protein [Alphaproteobacteria bacterium]MBT4016798.1 beta-lactamase family protein [Alphaproteobacteria bacterium]MBT5159863.1 beta-lactamase family protein [Alphaproteobacteria bacterium]MBT5918145.1 beta-lactamase family protein [Alphaproteobacteria bacterium]MBT6387676.1 beta-lactamase family protein [Alphaproteobacteria bacterium]
MNTSIHGYCDPAFQAVADAFELNFSERGEVGASVSVSKDGEIVVDLWGGTADVATGTPWQEDTVSIVYSCTKAATALCAQILIDRGELDLDGLICDVWPEFTGGGKERATVRMALNHSLGLPAWRAPLREGACYNWDHMVTLLENEEPWWTPGEKNGYHMISFGWTVGELVRRVSGKSLGQFFQDEIAGPLDLDFWIGLPEGIEDRVAPVIPFVPGPDFQPTAFVLEVMSNPASISHLALLNNGRFNANTREAHAAEIGGAGGIANARSLAKMFVPLAYQGANGKANGSHAILSPSRIDDMRRVSMETSEDQTLLIPTRFGQGFMLRMDNNHLPDGNSLVINDGAFGHVGMGGSVGFADPDCNMSMGYTMNKLGGGILLNERGQSLINAAYGCLV